jgi:hypothetical protein
VSTTEGNKPETKTSQAGTEGCAKTAHKPPGYSSLTNMMMKRRAGGCGTAQQQQESTNHSRLSEFNSNADAHIL